MIQQKQFIETLGDPFEIPFSNKNITSTYSDIQAISIIIVKKIANA